MRGLKMCTAVSGRRIAIASVSASQVWEIVAGYVSSAQSALYLNPGKGQSESGIYEGY